MSDQPAAARLLMIDDDGGFCRLVKRVAERHGFTVRSTDDPVEFKKIAEAWLPTLIITDLNMPGTDGVEILRDLGLMKCPAPVAVASGIDERTLDATLRLGSERGLKMAGVLAKPVALDVLEKFLLTHRPVDSATLTHDLAQAIAPKKSPSIPFVPDQFFLEYQPKVSSRRGEIIGVEALLRWRHPHLGLVGPDRFIVLAEENDLIDPLTDWVFATAVAQSAAWQRQNLALEVAVNVSAKNLLDIKFPDRLAQKCQEGGGDPGLLTIEVTETSAMRDPVHMLDVLSRLRIKGFKLSLDDFGTGYSSLVQLRKMPFSELKIDVSFVTNMLRDKDDRFIVEVTIDLARKLGVRSVAEGVESEAIWAALQEMGCDIGQGFYLGRPMSADRIVSAAFAANAMSNQSKRARRE
jgi:EAL domain-containing protein (putative c-di-GMP-specific phosphodiesterase class I)/ActR/RegA family two-component response regulator